MMDKDVFYLALEGEAFNNCANLDDFEIGEKLGEGGFGEVMLGTKKDSGQKVAVKFMDVSD
jgi:serine/threonine protein kinase